MNQIANFMLLAHLDVIIGHSYYFKELGQIVVGTINYITKYITMLLTSLLIDAGYSHYCLTSSFSHIQGEIDSVFYFYNQIKFKKDTIDERVYVPLMHSINITMWALDYEFEEFQDLMGDAELRSKRFLGTLIASMAGMISILCPYNFQCMYHVCIVKD